MTRPEERLYEKIWGRKLAQNIREGELRIRSALSLIPPGRYLLDVGCGDGSFAELVADRYDAIYGVDINRRALAVAMLKGVRVCKLNLNQLGLPFPDNEFDTVTCLDVIEHVFEPAELIREMARVLKPSGTLLISTPNIRYWRHIRSLLLYGKFPKTSGDSEGYDGGHLHYFTFRDLVELLQACGLRSVVQKGIMTERKSLRHRLGTYILGRRFEREFLSVGVLIQAVKPAY